MTKHETQITTPAGEPVIEVRRFLAAPRELVYRVVTEGEYLRRWWGPRRLEITECDVDLRVGGAWRIVHRAPDGTEFVFGGEFLELDPPRRRVGTWAWDGAPDEKAVETLELEEVEGGTLLVSTMVHPSVETRDMHVANGMEEGMVDSYARLNELLATVRAGEEGSQAP